MKEEGMYSFYSFHVKIAHSRLFFSLLDKTYLTKVLW